MKTSTETIQLLLIGGPDIGDSAEKEVSYEPEESVCEDGRLPLLFPPSISRPASSYHGQICAS